MDYQQRKNNSTFLAIAIVFFNFDIICSEGAQWRDFRTKVNPAMLKPKTIKLYTPGLEEISNDMVAR